MHDDRIDADLLEQHDIACERILFVALGHRVAAILYDQPTAGIAAHIG
jgi:hypothetical protein